MIVFCNEKPQCGQLWALSLIVFPHSGQVISAIAFVMFLHLWPGDAVRMVSDWLGYRNEWAAIVTSSGRRIAAADLKAKNVCVNRQCAPHRAAIRIAFRIECGMAWRLVATLTSGLSGGGDSVNRQGVTELFLLCCVGGDGLPTMQI